MIQIWTVPKVKNNTKAVTSNNSKFSTLALHLFVSIVRRTTDTVAVIIFSVSSIKRHCTVQWNNILNIIHFDDNYTTPKYIVESPFSAWKRLYLILDFDNKVKFKPCNIVQNWLSDVPYQIKYYGYKLHVFTKHIETVALQRSWFKLQCDRNPTTSRGKDID